MLKWTFQKQDLNFVQCQTSVVTIVQNRRKFRGNVYTIICARDLIYNGVYCTEKYYRCGLVLRVCELPCLLLMKHSVEKYGTLDMIM